jgi:hypothetical protein
MKTQCKFSAQCLSEFLLQSAAPRDLGIHMKHEYYREDWRPPCHINAMNVNQECPLHIGIVERIEHSGRSKRVVVDAISLQAMIGVARPVEIEETKNSKDIESIRRVLSNIAFTETTTIKIPWRNAIRVGEWLFLCSDNIKCSRWISGYMKPKLVTPEQMGKHFWPSTREDKSETIRLSQLQVWDCLHLSFLTDAYKKQHISIFEMIPEVDKKFLVKNFPPEKELKNLKLVVYPVGHGLFSCLAGDDGPVVVFDVGEKQPLNTKCGPSFVKCRIVFISHWHSDHWGMINKYPLMNTPLVVPIPEEPLPSSLPCVVFGKTVRKMSAATLPNGEAKEITIPGVVLYRGVQGGDNNSGIVLRTKCSCRHKDEKCMHEPWVLFSGDAKYASKWSRRTQKRLDTVSAEPDGLCFVIVPHHGGTGSEPALKKVRKCDYPTAVFSSCGNGNNVLKSSSVVKHRGNGWQIHCIHTNNCLNNCASTRHPCAQTSQGNKFSS